MTTKTFDHAAEVLHLLSVYAAARSAVSGRHGALPVSTFNPQTHPYRAVMVELLFPTAHTENDEHLDFLSNLRDDNWTDGSKFGLAEWRLVEKSRYLTGAEAAERFETSELNRETTPTAVLRARLRDSLRAQYRDAIAAYETLHLVEFGCLTDSILDYVVEGHAMGGFLESVFGNNLQRSFATADLENRALIPHLVAMIFNRLPARCQGSFDKLVDWRTLGGMVGFELQKAQS